jgi:serine/threonine-protein kinase
VPDASAAEERAAALIGRVLSDRYRIDGIVASGSMGAVYRGFHLLTRKEVAIKVLHPETENFPELVTRFEREAVAGAHIDHPNVASASDMGTFDQGSYFLVLELVRGRTLRDLLDREAPLRPSRALRIARQIAAGLGAAHARGIVHRDLKPLNVMVTDGPDERVKIIDFGLARVEVDQVAPMEGREAAERVSTPGVVFGTVAYMAPEVTSGMDAIDRPSDLYSLGLILYEMLTGLHPFEHGAFHEVIAQHRDKPPPSLRDRNRAVSVPPAIEAIVMRLLEKDPAQRYPDAESLLEALDAVMPEIEEASAPRAFVGHAQLPKTSRRNLALGLVGGALLVALSILLVAALRSRDDEPVAATSATLVTTASTTEPSAASPKRDLAAELRADLLAQAAKDDADGAASILVALADADPKALGDAKIRAAATKVATSIGERGGDEATQAFYALAYRFGSEGLDVLYDLSVDPAHQRAARRASAILEVQVKTGRPSAPLRIAIELKKAPCKKKALLFSRAAAEGDARVLALLEQLHPPGCDPESGACCYERHVGLEKTVEALKERAASK